MKLLCNVLKQGEHVVIQKFHQAPHKGAGGIKVTEVVIQPDGRYALLITQTYVSTEAAGVVDNVTQNKLQACPFILSLQFFHKVDNLQGIWFVDSSQLKLRQPCVDRPL